MSKAISRINYFGSNGEVVRTGVDAGGYDFIYETSTIRNPAYHPGDWVKLPDGREFTYAKSAGAITSNIGCSFTYTGYTAVTAFAVAAAIGDRSITIPAATHAALTEDELRNGYVVIGLGYDTASVQFRGIIGNDASILNVAFKVYLDAPLTSAITTSIYCETYKNPYGALDQTAGVTIAKAGIAAVTVSATDKYFWVQTKGLTWCSSAANVGGAKTMSACWRHSGTLDTAVKGICNATGDNGGDANVSDQIAGYCVTGSNTGNGPLFLLK
jgi:hypothetical protein